MSVSNDADKMPGWKPPFLNQKSKSFPSSRSIRLNSDGNESKSDADSGDEFFDCTTPPPSTPRTPPLQLPSEPSSPGSSQQPPQWQMLRSSKSFKESASKQQEENVGQQISKPSEGAVTQERLMLIRATAAERQRDLGEAHPKTLSACLALGRAYHQNGNLEFALPALESAYAGYVATCGSDHPRAMAAQLALAEAVDDGALMESPLTPVPLATVLDPSRKAAETAASSEGDAKTGASAASVSVAANESSRWSVATQQSTLTARAKELYQGVIASRAQALPRGSSSSSSSPKPGDSSSQPKSTGTSTSSGFGVDHLWRADVALAGLVARGGEAETAIELYRRALPGLDSSLGSNHAALLVCQFNLAGLLQQQAYAQSILPATSLRAEPFASKQNPNTVAPVSDESSSPAKDGETAAEADSSAADSGAAAAETAAAAAVIEAQTLLEAVCNGRTATLGPAHSDTLRALASLARLSSDATGKLGGGGAAYNLPLAVVCAERYLRGRAARDGPRHPRTLGAMLKLASLYSRDSSTRLRAVRTFKGAAAVLAESVGVGHPLHLQAQEGLAGVLLELSATVPDAAAKALEIRRSVAATLASAAALPESSPGAIAEAKRAQLLVADAVLRQPLPLVPDLDTAASSVIPSAADAPVAPAAVGGALSGIPDAASAAAVKADAMGAAPGDNASTARRAAEEFRARTKLAQQQCARRLVADAAAGLARALGPRHPEAIAARQEVARLLRTMASDADAAAKALLAEAATYDEDCSDSRLGVDGERTQSRELDEAGTSRRILRVLSS